MNVLIKPIVTEKMSAQAEKHNRFGFIVNAEANKLEIKSAIEKMYGVKVASVNTQQFVGKMKQRNTTRGLAIGRVSNHKKAYVTLKDGDTIDFYASI